MSENESAQEELQEQVLLYDCFSGIAGDMHIGAMLDLGVPLDYLRDELARLPVASEFSLHVQRDKRRGISGQLAGVELVSGIHKPHRHLSDVLAIIRDAGYADSVLARAEKIFTVLAQAEATVHGTTPQRIHFHEVGATDAIVDITAAALALDWLNPTAVYCGPVEVGGGTVQCDHGLMPVPVPATAELLKGVALTYGRVQMETATPTGAAILRASVDEFSLPNNFRISHIGTGLGQKDFPVANVVRVMLGSIEQNAAQHSTTTSTVTANTELACNVDDMTAEALGALMEKLFRAGALDVFFTPIVMKKSRPGTRVSVLADAEHLEVLRQLLFTDSSTIGVREHTVDKTELARETLRVATSYGEVRVKRVELPVTATAPETEGGQRRWKVEYDDLTAIAERTGLSFIQVQQRIQEEVLMKLESNTPTADLRDPLL